MPAGAPRSSSRRASTAASSGRCSSPTTTACGPRCAPTSSSFMDGLFRRRSLPGPEGLGRLLRALRPRRHHDPGRHRPRPGHRAWSASHP
ncbi:MAG: hypothetical protein MZW92_65560 [Comamonadaceae bacterium]|nr:hypothetical protein [Comamonadaceae bacterium]